MDTTTLQIVTLGHPGVGKTTYMASLYGALQNPYAGFSLRTDKADDSSELLGLARDIQTGQYPPGTARRSSYAFGLHYGEAEVVRFQWADYKGGALHARLDEQADDSLQLKGLIEDLGNADGLLMLCDGAALARSELRQSQIGRLVVLATRALQQVSRPLALALVLTKCDSVAGFAATHFAQLRLDALFAAINRSSNVRAALIPVACGQSLLNVTMPLFFTLSAALSSQALRFEDLARAKQELHERLDQENSGIRRLYDQVKSAITGGPTLDTRMISAGQEAESASRAAARLRESLDAIIQQVEQLPTVNAASTLEDYAERLNQAARSAYLHEPPRPASPSDLPFGLRVSSPEAPTPEREAARDDDWFL